MFGRYDPALLKPDPKKLRYIRRLICTEWRERIGFTFGTKRTFKDALSGGDTQPAVVYSTSPLIISVYSDEFDAVRFFRFPDELAVRYSLNETTMMTASCMYDPRKLDVPDDLFPGENASYDYCDFIPFIHLFLAKDDGRLRDRTDHFSAAEWDHVEKLTRAYAQDHPGLSCDGFGRLKKYMMRWFTTLGDPDTFFRI